MVILASSSESVPIIAAGSDGHSHDHGSHQKQAPSPQAQAKLISANQVTPNTPVSVTIEVQDQQGQPITQFEEFQKKLMHLIVVSDDLQFFNHIHPEYRQNGRFEVTTTFPKAGGYTLFSDYKPAQQPETVSALKIQASGTVVAPPPIDRRLTKTFGNIQANLEISQAKIKAGEPVVLNFNLQHSEHGEPIADLQAYLGERGHLVILKHTSSPSRADYIHAHALSEQQKGQVQFHTSFPEPGSYKLWGQFKPNGKIVTTDFWVDVL